MNIEDTEKIYSNEYADFFLYYNGDMSILKKFQESAVVNVINYFLAVVYLPLSEVKSESFYKISYVSTPAICGLSSQSSLESSGITKLRNNPYYNLRGEGVLIGFVDTGIDYTNPIFIKEDNTTKISRIWDQTIISTQSSVFSYGTEYTKEMINEALQSSSPFEIVPSKDDIGHGTMVAGIAAGNDVSEMGFYGIATKAELVVVKLKPAKTNLKEYYFIPQDAIAYQENDLIAGIQYLINYAHKVNKPIVICSCCDTSEYAHEGLDITSKWLSLTARLIGISMIIPVGNEGNRQRHFLGEITESTKNDLIELNVALNEKGLFFEIWGMAPYIYSIDIITPSGEYKPRIQLKLTESRVISFIFEKTIIFINYQLVGLETSDPLIQVRMKNPSPGIWRFNVYARGGKYPIKFNAWLPMNDFISTDTYFIRSNPYVTLNSFSCADVPITVTAYNAEDGGLYLNASKGYTRIGGIKPEIAAPGVNIVSPTLNHGFATVTGTSVAAAHTAGVAAMLFEWGTVKGNYPYMNSNVMKILMIQGANRKNELQYPNEEWGYGKLDIYTIFDRLRGNI